MHALILSAAALCAASIFACSASSQPQSAASPGAVKPAADKSEGCVVVELFTSEGCSSCPPADKVLADLPGAVSGKTVIPLAFHVDYWDYIGWKDRFATPEFTQRQRQYAAKLDSGTYTPQMIVNGHAQFVGSDKSAAVKAIKAAPSTTVAFTMAVAPRKAGEPVRIEATLADGAKMPASARFFAALTEDHLSSEVKRGENASRTLKHEGVVRAFTRHDAKAAAQPDASDSAKPEPATTLTLTPPSDMKEANAHVIVFVQDETSFAVLGAATAPLAASR